MRGPANRFLTAGKLIALASLIKSPGPTGGSFDKCIRAIHFAGDTLLEYARAARYPTPSGENSTTRRGGTSPRRSILEEAGSWVEKRMQLEERGVSAVFGERRL